MGLVAFFDGGIRPKQKIAAGAAVLYDGTEEVDHAARLLISADHDPLTNQVAEYEGLMVALELCWRHGERSPTVYGDSEVIVRQARGDYKCRAVHLRPYFSRVRAYAHAYFDEVKIIETPHARDNRGKMKRRGSNERADYLCGLAMDVVSDIEFYERSIT